VWSEQAIVLWQGFQTFLLAASIVPESLPEVSRMPTQGLVRHHGVAVLVADFAGVVRGRELRILHQLAKLLP